MRGYALTRASVYASLSTRIASLRMKPFFLLVVDRPASPDGRGIFAITDGSDDRLAFRDTGGIGCTREGAGSWRSMFDGPGAEHRESLRKRVLLEHREDLLFIWVTLARRRLPRPSSCSMRVSISFVDLLFLPMCRRTWWEKAKTRSAQQTQTTMPPSELVECPHCHRFVTPRTARRHRAQEINFLVGYRSEAVSESSTRVSHSLFETYFVIMLLRLSLGRKENQILF